MATVCLDASALIYLIEGEPDVQHHVKSRLASTTTPLVIVVSRLSLLECRVKPMCDGNASSLARYDELFEQENLRVVEIDAAVIDLATQLRAEHGFKTADAIQLATALSAHADLLLTGDRQFIRCPGLHVEVVPA